jgi:hypothetical protein
MKYTCRIKRAFLSILIVVVSCFLSAPLFAAKSSTDRHVPKRETIVKKKLTANGTGLTTRALAGQKVAAPTFRYIIQGKEKSVVAALAESGKTDVNSVAGRSRRAFLETSQSDLHRAIEAVLGHQVSTVSSLKTALNAIVLELTENEAESLAGIPGIKRIQQDELRPLHQEQVSYFRYAQPENGTGWLLIAIALSGITLLVTWILIRKRYIGRNIGLFSAFLLVSGFVLIGCHEGGYS